MPSPIIEIKTLSKLPTYGIKQINHITAQVTNKVPNLAIALLILYFSQIKLLIEIANIDFARQSRSI